MLGTKTIMATFNTLATRKGDTMKVWNVTEEDIRAAASAAQVAIHSDWNGNGITRAGKTERSPLAFRLALGTVRVEEGRQPGSRKPYPLIWQRASASYFEAQKEEPRRVAAVCWHGHYAFMRYLLALRPDARIKTAFADYRGLAAFLWQAPDTGTRNIGAPIMPVAMEDACYCREHGREDICEIDTRADVWAHAFLDKRIRAAREHGREGSEQTALDI